MPHDSCHVGQHAVSDGVPETVVNRLEVVEVDERDGMVFAAFARAADRVFDPLEHRAAVRQTGQRIVQCLE